VHSLTAGGDGGRRCLLNKSEEPRPLRIQTKRRQREDKEKTKRRQREDKEKTKREDKERERGLKAAGRYTQPIFTNK
jgi:hypothetical protein